MRAVTFSVTGHETSTVIEALTGVGFVFGPSRTLTTTLLDTFDGRVHRGGLRLQLNESDHAELVLSGAGTVPAHLAIGSVPRVPTDVPPGPFRSRIAGLVDGRALLPQLQVTAELTRGMWRDGAGKVVVTAELHEQLRVVEPADTDFAAATIEIHEVPGYTKQIRRTIETLRSMGLVESEPDTWSQCAVAAGVDLAGFSAQATVPMDPEMAAAEGARLVLANLATAIVANWQGTVDQVDPEFLHDLRIAMRRTRTILGEAKSVLPDAIVGPARSGFAWLAGLTGTPRDLDVYLLEWSRYTDPLGSHVTPALAPVRELLERRRADAHIELERGMRSERAAELMNRWQTWLAQPVDTDDFPPRASRPLGRLVVKRIARSHTVLLDRGRLIDADTPAEQIHDLRKDAKRLRYLLECFGSLIPKSARAPYVKRLKALQDNLGEHQDAEVHVDMLRAIGRELHAAGASPDTMLAIGQLTERLDRQRVTARAEFAERFADYDTPATQHALDAVLEGIAT